MILTEIRVNKQAGGKGERKRQSRVNNELVTAAGPGTRTLDVVKCRPNGTSIGLLCTLVRGLLFRVFSET